jgi:hypothetical protein
MCERDQRTPMRSTTRVAKRKNNLLYSSPFVLVLVLANRRPTFCARNARAGDTPVRHSCCWKRSRETHTASTYNVVVGGEALSAIALRDILKTRLAIGANYTLSTLSFARPHVAAFAYVRRTHTPPMQAAISQPKCATRTSHKIYED